MKKQLIFQLLIIAATHVCFSPAVELTAPSSVEQCSSENDLGKMICVSLEAYTGWQWATCVTNKHIITNSAKYSCSDAGEHQCWYPCQVDLFGRMDGGVNKTCQCQPGATTEPLSVSATLPPECFNPVGNCTWYSKCVEAKYPCRGTNYSYAIDYGERFCTSFVEKKSSFSAIGQQWLDQVRTCLQLSLVDILRPSAGNETCESIWDKAFSSHVPCYVDGQISVCDLPCLDFIRLLATVFPALEEGGNATKDTFKQMIDVAEDCLQRNHSKAKCLVTSMKVFQLELDIYLNDKQVTNRSDIMSKIVAVISQDQGWASKGLQWISHHSHGQMYPSFQRTPRHALHESKPEHLEVRIFLTLNNPLPSMTESQQNSPKQAVHHLATAIRSEPFLQNIIINVNGSHFKVKAHSITECLDFQCTSTNPDITNVQPLPEITGFFPR